MVSCAIWNKKAPVDFSKTQNLGNFTLFFLARHDLFLKARVAPAARLNLLV